MHRSQCGGDGVHYLGAALVVVKSGACVRDAVGVHGLVG